MKLPRDRSGEEIIRGLPMVSYETTRQKGDLVYMTTQSGGEHHFCIPLHNPVKTGTLAAILGSVASHLRVSREELLRKMKV